MVIRGIKMRCPDCASRGADTQLKLRQVNLTEALYMCESSDCGYPDTGSTWIVVARSIEEIFTEETHPTAEQIDDIDAWVSGVADGTVSSCCSQSKQDEPIPSPSVSIDSGFSEASNLDILAMPVIFEDELEANMTGSNGIPLVSKPETGYDQVLSELEDMLMGISRQDPLLPPVMDGGESVTKPVVAETDGSDAARHSSDKFKDFKFKQLIIKPATQAWNEPSIIQFN